MLWFSWPFWFVLFGFVGFISLFNFCRFVLFFGFIFGELVWIYMLDYQGPSSTVRGLLKGKTDPPVILLKLGWKRKGKN